MARRLKRDQAPPRGTPEVFVVRRPVANLVFGWEIRRFGAVVLNKSSMDFSTLQAAQAAGDVALRSMMSQA